MLFCDQVETAGNLKIVSLTWVKSIVRDKPILWEIKIN